MANERTVLERILNPDIRPGRSARDRRQQLADSVIEHLMRMLNSRQGCALTVDDYGMPDFNDSAGSKIEIRTSMETVLRNSIQKYEPRLRRVIVRMEQDEGTRLNPRFTITAELATTDDTQRQISFATVMDPTGQLTIT